MEFLKFIGSRFMTMLLEVVGVFILLELEIFGKMWPKIMVSFLIVILNYTLSQLYIFKTK